MTVCSHGVSLDCHAPAVRLIHSAGTGELTMRHLAADLDTGAASPYVYFKDTDPCPPRSLTSFPAASTGPAGVSRGETAHLLVDDLYRAPDRASGAREDCPAHSTERRELNQPLVGITGAARRRQHCWQGGCVDRRYSLATRNRFRR